MSNYITRTTQVVVLLEDQPIFSELVLPRPYRRVVEDHAPTTRHDDGCDPGAAEDVEPEGGI